VPGDGAAGTPAHSASSGPDVSQVISSLLLKQLKPEQIKELVGYMRSLARK